MLEKKSFKENVKTEIEKLKKMSSKDKVWYIKEYYGIQIVLTILILAFSISLIFNMFFKKDPVFNVVFLNKPINNESYEKISSEFHNYANFDATNDYWELKPTVSVILKDNEIVNGLEYLAKINAMIATQTLDTLVTEEYFIDHFCRQDILTDLEKFLPKDLLEKVKDSLVYKVGIDGIERAYALDVSNAPIIKDSVYVAGPVYFSILANSKNIDTSILFLRYLYSM
ncbi:hypothetical protein [uncultured Tyzzerella sp.]|uniref:hypothetical protein n=1 Tax=uncultured Tyzzerella sp. TaxID=2321398 RepID=UPI002942E23A|nr:hypothetical protein [uncultured Tyzzerella sp.]